MKPKYSLDKILLKWQNINPTHGFTERVWMRIDANLAQSPAAAPAMQLTVGARQWSAVAASLLLALGIGIGTGLNEIRLKPRIQHEGRYTFPVSGTITGNYMRQLIKEVEQ